MFEAAKKARKIWQVGDRVRVWSGQEYDGHTGSIYCVPSPKHPNWLYTVNLDEPGDHTCVFCRHDEMEPLCDGRRLQLEVAGILPQDRSGIKG